jgi:hypothetical protein
MAFLANKDCYAGYKTSITEFVACRSGGQPWRSLPMRPKNQAVVSDPRAGRTMRHPHALLIVGMHRSGTSYLGSLFSAAGVHLGDQLLGRSRGNQKGHFEDHDFLSFHERCLHAHGLGTEGYATTERTAVPERLRQDALRLIASRRERGTVWGWKDPRTTLFLDFWEGVLPEAKFVFVFRRPWEVVESLFRRGDPSFQANPPHAIDVWTHYNRLLIDFYQRHPRKTFLCEITRAIESPSAVFAQVREKLGIALGQPPRLFEADLFHQDAGSGHAHLLRVISKEAHSLYFQLRELAGSATEFPASDENTVDIHRMHQQVLQDWVDAIARSQERDDLRQQLEEAHMEIGRLQAKRDRTLTRRLTHLYKKAAAIVRRSTQAGRESPAQHPETEGLRVFPGLQADLPAPLKTALHSRRRAA